MSFTVKVSESNEEKSIQEREQAVLDKAAAEEEAKRLATKTEETEESKQEDKEIDDTVVLSWFEKKGKKVDSIDDLFKSPEPQIVEKEVELPDDISAILKYKKETGRGVEDFIKLNRDYDSMNEDALLFEFEKSRNPKLDASDIREILEEKYMVDEDEDEDSVSKRKKREKKVAISEAKDYFNKLKETYSVPLESRGLDVPSEEKEAYERFKQSTKEAAEKSDATQNVRNEFVKKTEELFSDKFEGFEFSIGEEKKLFYKVGDVSSLKENQLNISNLMGKFFDDKGVLINPEAYHRAMLIASDPDKYAKYFYEQGKSDGIVDLDVSAKNIDMRSTPQVVSTGGLKISVAENSQGKGGFGFK